MSASESPQEHTEHEAGTEETSFQSLDRTQSSTHEEAEETESNPIGAAKHRTVVNPPAAPQTMVLLDQERYLPIANVVRIMKTQMDPAAKLAKDAKECVQECVSEFISFIASEAASICHRQRRKTITADDLLTAMEATGFDNYAEPMRIFLMKYRQAHKITGPIHREHANYSRPIQFRNDAPVRPLFFDTEHGRRCTETQYVINGSELVKNAPLGDEWDEQTGTLIDHSQPTMQQPSSSRASAPGTSSEHFEPPTVTVIPRKRPPIPPPPLEPIPPQHPSGVEGLPQRMYVIDDQSKITLPNGSIELEQEQSMQLYIDPVSKQHFAAKETANGLVILPIQIDDTPLHLENVNDLQSYMAQMPMVKDQSAALSTSSVASTSSVSPRKRVIHLPGRHESGNLKTVGSYHGGHETASTSSAHRPPPNRRHVAAKKKRTS